MERKGKTEAPQNSTEETKNGTKVRSCMRMWMKKIDEGTEQTD